MTITALHVTCLRRDEEGEPYWRRLSGRPCCSAPGNDLVHVECLLATLKGLDDGTYWE